MAAQDLALEIPQYAPLVPVKRARAWQLIGLSFSVLVHAMGIFALLQRQPALAADGGATEIPVEIVIEAGGSAPAATQSAPPAPAEPAKAALPAPAELAKAALPESAPPVTAETPPPPPPAVAAAEPGAPPETEAVRPPAETDAEPIVPPPSAAAPVEPTQAAPSPPEQHPEAAAEHRRQEMLQRQREKAEAEKKAAAAKAKKEAAEEKRKREDQRAAARAAAHDRQAALEGSADAAPAAHAAPTPGGDFADYRSAVLRHLAMFKRYPENARERSAHGRAVVTFNLDRAGHVVSAAISHSSGDADIDAETLAMVRRAEPFPPPPPGAPRSFSPAIEFHLQ